MGIKFSVIGGGTEVRYSDLKILNHFTKVWSFYVSPCHLRIADHLCYAGSVTCIISALPTLLFLVGKHY